MSTVQEIEQAILQLPAERLAELRSWFLELDNDLWDAQIDRDVKAGKLDALAEHAIAEFRAGNCRDL